MAVILYAIGLLQIIAGIAVALSAKSAIHEILGSIAFGMGVLSAGLAAIVSKLAAVQSASEKQAAIFQSIMDSRKA